MFFLNLSWFNSSVNVDVFVLWWLTKTDVSFRSGFGVMVQRGQFDKLVNSENA